MLGKIDYNSTTAIDKALVMFQRMRIPSASNQTRSGTASTPMPHRSRRYVLWTACMKLTDRLKYFESFAQKYDLFPYIKLSSKVTSATWDEAKGIYNLKINSGGNEIEDWCHVLVNGTGFLNDWKWPK